MLARRGLVGLLSVLDSPFAYVPHDIIVPGALAAGDLCDLAAALAPTPLRMEALVDGRNVPAGGQALERCFEPTRRAYAARADAFAISEDRTDASGWLIGALGGD